MGNTGERLRSLIDHFEIQFESFREINEYIGKIKTLGKTLGKQNDELRAEIKMIREDFILNHKKLMDRIQALENRL